MDTRRRWEPDLLLGTELRGATLGILGLGPIGQAVAQRAHGFGLRVLGWTPSGRAVDGVEACSFEAVVQQADFLSLHLALVPETRHIINAQVLRQMPQQAVLINTARGGLVDEQALIEAMATDEIRGAALDVFEQEPISNQHPLLNHPRAVLAPHIGSATHKTRCAMAELAVDNLIAGLQGQPMPHCFNSDALRPR